MTTVRQNILSGETSSLALFIFDNPHSVVLAVDTLGYFFLSLAVLSIAPIFSHGRTEAGIRWLFIATGVLGVLGTVGLPLTTRRWVLAHCCPGCRSFSPRSCSSRCSGVHGSRVIALRGKQLGETRPRCHTRRVNRLSVRNHM